MIIEGKCFLFLIETICCDPLSELSRRDSSDERSRFYAELSSNTPSYLELCHCLIQSNLLMWSPLLRGHLP